MHPRRGQEAKAKDSPMSLTLTALGASCNRKMALLLGPLLTLPSSGAYPVEKSNYLKCWTFLEIEAIFPACVLNIIISTVKMVGRKHDDRFGDKIGHSTLGFPSFQSHVLATGPHLSELSFLAVNTDHNLL